jgi:DnaJ-class molecular chaperone
VSASDWTSRKCPNCEGHGQVCEYSFGGGDFEGPAECKDCNGTGQIWKSPRGALAQYPGGKFLGSERVAS